MIDIDKVSNLGKDYDFVLEDGSIKTLKCFELTIKEKRNISEIIKEKIKSVNRKEAIKFSEELPVKDRISYLVAASKDNNNISDEEIELESKSVYGMIEILKISSRNNKLDWETIIINNNYLCARVYFYAVNGLDIPENLEDAIEDKKDDQEVVIKTEEKQAEKFC